MIIVHHLLDSRSNRILWLLEELGVPYRVEVYARDPKTRLAPPDLKKIHPLGKSPVIEDGEVVLAESGPIIQYLCGRYGQGRLAPLNPADGTDPQARNWTYWLHYAEGSVMPLLGMRLLLSRLPEETAGPMKSGFLDPQIALHMDFWEATLQQSAWFGGDDFSAADIMMGFPLEIAAQRIGFGSERTASADFLERIHSRAACQAAAKRAALPETVQ